MSAGSIRAKRKTDDFSKSCPISGYTASGALGGNMDPYRFHWDQFFKANQDADAAAIYRFRDEFRSLTSQAFKTADDLNWPYPKTTP